MLVCVKDEEEDGAAEVGVREEEERCFGGVGMVDTKIAIQK